MATIKTKIPIDRIQSEPVRSSSVNIAGLWWSVEYHFDAGGVFYGSLECMRNYKDYPNIDTWEAIADVRYRVWNSKGMILETAAIRDMPKYFNNGNDLHLANEERIASRSILSEKLENEHEFNVHVTLSNVCVRKPISISELADDPDPMLLAYGPQAYVFKRKYRGKPVAVKEFKTKEYYERERKMLLTLKDPYHPNLLQMITYSDLNMFILFEHCPSVLCQRIHDPSYKLHCNLFTTWVESLVEAIHYLHQQDIVVGDIRSDNVLIASDNTLRLSDFGILKGSRTMNTIATHRLDSEHYKTPEVKHQKREDEKSDDIYSFGVLLWEMSTRTKPNKVPADSPISAINVSQKQLPTQLLWMISKCTIADPEHRASSTHLRDDGIWDSALAYIRLNKKDWPEDYEDARGSANGWHYTHPTPEVNVSCILNSSNEDLYTLVATNADMCAALKQAKAGRFSKYVRLPPGQVHRFTYPKIETNPHFSLFRANGEPWREMNRIPIGRSIMCDGVDVFLTVVDDIWTAEKHM